MNGRSNNSTVIDATTDKVVGTVDLGGKPEEPALDGRGNMFVNLEDKSSIMEFDTKTLAVKGTWSLAPCDGPSALAADTKNHRLFAACDKMIAVVNADTGKVVATPAIGGDPDGDGFDPGTGLVFASCPRRIADRDSRRLARQVQHRGQRQHAIRRAHHDARSEDASRLHGDGRLQARGAGDAGQSAAASTGDSELVRDSGAGAAVGAPKQSRERQLE